LQLTLRHREFKYISVIYLLKILTLPFSSSVLADDLGLGEGDVVQLPLGSDLGDVAEINLDGAALIHVTDAKVQLIHGLIVLAWLLSQEDHLRSQ